MPTEKPLPDDTIIDLTDLVEEDHAKSAPTTGDASVDMSFEQELDDLFGDVTPEPKKDAPTPAPPTPDDIIDLEGLEVAEEPAPAAKAAPHVSPEPAAEPADSLADLADLAEEHGQPADLELPPPAAATPPSAPAETPVSVADMDLPSLEPQPAAQPAPEAVDDLLGELPESPTAATDESSVEISDLHDVQPLEERTPPAAKATGTPPAIDLDALDQIIQTAKGPVPEPVSATAPDALATLAARLETLEQTTAAVADQVQALLDAPNAEALATRLEQTLDVRLDTLRADLAPAPAAPASDGEALAQLRAELLAAIETAKTAPPSVEALRAALAPDFEALRQGLPQAEPGVSKADLAEAMAAIKAELLTAIEGSRPDPAALTDQFSALLESRLAALRQELPGPEAFVTPQGLGQAFRELRESLSRDLTALLETARQAAKTEAKAVGDALTARIAALEAERLDPAALAEQVRQAVLPHIPDIDGALATAAQTAKAEAQAMDDALAARIDTLETQAVDPEALTERVRQAIMAAIPDVPAAMTGLRESLSQDLSAALETAKQASKEAADAMGQALSERILPLETNRVDQHALDSLVKTEDFQAALNDLRAEIADDIIRRVPQAAAAVIREEIAALAKELDA